MRRVTITTLQGFYSVCAATQIVGHGNADGILLEDIYMRGVANIANGGCWGIGIDTGYDASEGQEIFKNLIIRGSRVINVGGLGISCTSCVAPIIENNIIGTEDGPDMIAIAVPNRAKGAEDATTTGAKIRFNTIFFLATKAYHQGIGFTQATADPGTQLEVVGNVIYMGTAVNSNHQCFDTTGLTLATNFTRFSDNLCYDASGNGVWDARGTPIDSNRVTTDPLFAQTPGVANGFAVDLQASSPAVTNSTSNTYAPKLDQKGCQRGTTVHRGARQYFASACTVAPQTPVGFR